MLRRFTSRRKRENSENLQRIQLDGDFTGNCKSVTYYLSHVEKHLNPKVVQRKKPKHKHVRGLVPLKNLLVSFIRDLENNSMGLWFNELVCDQQRGHELFLKLLSSLVETRTRSGRKAISRDGTEQELCARCLMMISSNRLGLNCLAAYENGYQILILSIERGEQSTIKHICAILIQYCKLSNVHHTKLISHLDCFKKKHQYESKFTVIIQHLKVRAEDFSFTSAVLNLLSAVVHSSSSLNTRTFHQQEVELEINMEKTIEGVPTSAVSLHTAMSQWTDNCIDIPVITARLDAAQTSAGLLQEECRLLREKLSVKEEATKKLAAKQKQLLGSNDSAANELSDMRARLDEMSKALIREKVKVQRLEQASVPGTNEPVSITSFVHPSSAKSRDTKARSSHHEKSNKRDEGSTPEAVHRRRTGSRTKRHHDGGDTEKRYSNSSGSDNYYNRSRTSSVAVNVALNQHSVQETVPPLPSRNSAPDIPLKFSSLSRQCSLGGIIPPPAPPAPPPPQLPPGTVIPVPVRSVLPTPVVAPPPAPPPPSLGHVAPFHNSSVGTGSYVSSHDSSVRMGSDQAPVLPPKRGSSFTRSISSEGTQPSTNALIQAAPPTCPEYSTTSFGPAILPPSLPTLNSTTKQPHESATPGSIPEHTVPNSATLVPSVTVPNVPPAPTVPPVQKAPPVPIAPPVPTAPTAPKPPSAPVAPKPPSAPGAPKPPSAPGAPKPPSAPGAPKALTLSKTPTVKLPLFHWQAVRSGSYWQDVDMGSVLDKLNLAQFEEQFKMKAKPSVGAVAKVIKRKVECLSLLEQNRSRNAMIIQKRVALKPPEVAKCVEHTDLGELPVWAVELLHGCVPSKDEIDKLLQNGDKLTQFGEAEVFCYHLSQVTRYDRKLGIMQFIGTFDEQYSRLLHQVTCVRNASYAIKDSARLKSVLELILALGNYMNSGRKGVASGFKIQSLSKVSETHSGDYKFTLLHYIVKTIHTTLPDLIGFTVEFGVLDDAQKVSLKELIEEVQEMKKNIDTVLDERDKQPDNFIIFSFYNRAHRKIKRLGEQTKQMLESYEQVCKAFGENPKRIQPAEFFRFFVDFFIQFDKTEKEYNKSNSVNPKKRGELTRETSRNLINEAIVKHASMH